MAVRVNEAKRTAPKASLPVPRNLKRAFRTAGKFENPLETGARKAVLADVLASSRMPDADDEESIVQQGTCHLRSGEEH